MGWAAPGGKSPDPQHNTLWAFLVLGAPGSGETYKEPAIKFREGTFEGVRLQTVSALPRAQRDLHSHQASNGLTVA